MGAESSKLWAPKQVRKVSFNLVMADGGGHVQLGYKPKHQKSSGDFHDEAPPSIKLGMKFVMV